ncbi:MAG: SDR family NAD(P)-dependent oxidoreductase, partial [Actinomyces sp.]
MAPGDARHPRRRSRVPVAGRRRAASPGGGCRPVSTDRHAGRVVLVTGGGSGIGRATALRLAAEGAAVGVLDRDLDAATAVADDITATGHRAC